MKKYFLLGILSIIIISMNCCKKDNGDNDPVASFSISKTTAKVGETITFTNLSTNFGGFIWNFGDGTLVEGVIKNPTHSYSSVGSFTISLTIATRVGSNSKKIGDVAYKTIVITP